VRYGWGFADFLLYSGLYAPIESDIPEELHTEDTLDYCFDRFKGMHPIHQWLLAVMERV
jgi:hypothetical protein